MVFSEMSVEQLIYTAEHEGSVTIRCESYEQCEDITRILLDNGAIHGDSGWSERIINGDHDHWMHPYVKIDRSIEYYGSGANISNNPRVIDYCNVYAESEDDSRYEAINNEDLLSFLAIKG